MTTAQDQQSRAVIAAWNAQADEHNQWETLGDDEKIEWAMQAARALPAPVICYVRTGSTLPRRMGWETCAATDAGALAVHADGRALPDEGLEPVAWTVAGAVTNWARDFSKYKTQHYVRPVFTAAQVLAMGRVPPGWQPVPVEPTGDMLVAIMSSGEVDVLRETPEKHQVLLIDRAGIPARYTALLAAAPRPPATQERAYICPTSTVADLVNNLLLLDQALPIYGAQYIEHPPGKRRAIAVPPTVSRERVMDERWIGEGAELNAAVIWTRAEQPAAQEPKPLIARQLGEWHEDDGAVAWWAWCGREWAGEAAWLGTPNSSDWPGYHTHWTPHPQFPDAPEIK